MLNLTLSPTIRVYVYALPSDMRRQFDGLAALVTHDMKCNVRTGDYFVFFNRRCTMCKIICWESGGYSLYARRLERGTFRRPAFDGASFATQIDAVTLAMLLAGVDFTTTTRRRRYTSPNPATTAAAI